METTAEDSNKEGTSLYSLSWKRLWKPHLCLKSRQHKDNIQLLKGSFSFVLCALMVKRSDDIIIFVQFDRHECYGTSLLSLNRCSLGLNVGLLFCLFRKSVDRLGLVLSHHITAFFFSNLVQPGQK